MIDNIRYSPPPLGKSDNLAIQFSLIKYINRFRSQTGKNYFNENYDQLRMNLKNMIRDEAITDAMNLKESWESFTDIINHEVSKHTGV